MAQLERVGVFGGTFDPPHRGHIAVATSAQEHLKLDVVWWIPVGDPPHKAGQTVSSVEHRFQMVELTLAAIDNPAFSLLSTDRDRPGPHFMVDTIAILYDDYHPRQMFLIIGEDSLFDIPDWSRPELLVERTTLAVYQRDGTGTQQSNLDPILTDLKQQVTYLPGPALAISSSKIRQAIRDGRPIEDHVMPEVAQYIARNNLYE